MNFLKHDPLKIIWSLIVVVTTVSIALIVVLFFTLASGLLWVFGYPIKVTTKYPNGTEEVHRYRWFTRIN